MFYVTLPIGKLFFMFNHKKVYNIGIWETSKGAIKVLPIECISCNLATHVNIVGNCGGWPLQASLLSKTSLVDVGYYPGTR